MNSIPEASSSLVSVLTALQNNPMGAICLVAVAAFAVLALAIWKR